MADQRYKIYEQLGAGGNGAVYRAYDTQLKRWVAIKRLLTATEAASEDPSTAELRREADTLASLRNANIVTIFDVGTDDEGLFMVMELLEGPDLADTIATAPLGFDDFKQLAEQTLEALLAAHQLRILHRDIKPENIKVERLPGGRLQAKLIDFGLARAGLGARKQTEDHTGSVMGSIYYMAPEQLSREPVDVRTDLYALGCVLYEAIAARKPFDGKTVNEVIDKHLDHDVVPLGQLCPHLPQWLTYWVMRLMACKPDDRPATAQQAIEEFRAWEKLPPQPQMMPWMPQGYGYGGYAMPPGQAYVMPPQTGGIPLQTTGYHLPAQPQSGSAPIAVPVAQPAEEPVLYATAVAEQPQVVAPPKPQSRQGKPGKPFAATKPTPGATPQPGANNKKWIFIGAAAVVVITALVMLLSGGKEKTPAPVASSSPKPSTGGNPATTFSDADESQFPSDRPVPIVDHVRVVHYIAKAGVRNRDAKPVDANQNEAAFWADLAARGRNTQLAVESGRGVPPRRVSWSGGALKAERFALRFSQSDQPSAMRIKWSDQVKNEFPFAANIPGHARGLTLGVALQADKNRLPTRVLTLSCPDGKGSVVLRINKAGAAEATFTSDAGTKTLTVPEVNCTEAATLFVRWNGETGDIQLRARNHKSNIAKDDNLKAPSSAAYGLAVGDAGDSPADQFHGHLAECVVYAAALKDDQLALLSKSVNDYYIQVVTNPPKPPGK